MPPLIMEEILKLCSSFHEGNMVTPQQRFLHTGASVDVANALKITFSLAWRMAPPEKLTEVAEADHAGNPSAR